MNKKTALIAAAFIVTIVLIAVFGLSTDGRSPGMLAAQSGAGDCVELYINGVLVYQSAACTPEPTETAEVPPSETPEPSSDWHSPTTHEHGDEPPQWVTASDLQPYFGTAEKHEGYKAMWITEDIARGWRGDQKAIYFIFHAFSFPPAMRVQFHSYQLWILHSDDTVTWMQGKVDTGEYPDHRVDKCTDNRNKPDMRIPFLSSGCISLETWYPHGNGMHPDLVRAMSGGYWFDPDDDMNDPTTWDIIPGQLGLVRLDTAIVLGKYIPQDGDFCADAVTGEIVDCDDGLPQYISPTFFTDCAGPDCEIRGEAQKTFPGPDVELPN